jgi:flavocytochrome c
MNDFEVVVVGSGAAGLSAALTAAEAGSSVLVVEATETIGGSSRLSGGQMMGAGTRLQRELGINDSADALYQHYMNLNQWVLEPGVVRRFADEAGPAVDWVESLGVVFKKELFYSGDESAPRDHAPDEAGSGVVGVLLEHCKKNKRIEFALSRRIDRLVGDDGRVVGVSVGDDEVHCGAVVLATGGFGANREMLEKYYPAALEAGEWFWYVGGEGSRGDAITVTEEFGAQVVGANRGLMLLTPNFGHLLEVYFPGWLVMVNQQGHRFFDEMSSYSITEPIVRRQNGPVYAIFDSAGKASATRSGSSASKKRPDMPGPTVRKFIEPVLDDMIASGVIGQAETIAELASLVGLPADNLVAAVAVYNEDIAAGHDRFYHKRADLMQPLSSPPYYVTELRLAHLPLTATGVRIDAEARVIADDSRPIGGLFAAGECCGGVIGDIYVGSGNSYTNAVAFGRVAGRNAAASAASLVDSLAIGEV